MSRHRSVALVCALAWLAYGLGGAAQAWIAAVGALFAASGWLTWSSPTPRALALWRLAHLIVLLSVTAVLMLGVSPKLVAGALLGWLMVHRAWSARTARAQRWGLVLSWILAGLAALDTPRAWPALVFIVMLTPVALVRLQLDSERDRARRTDPWSQVRLPRTRGLAPALLVLPVAALIFLLLPRPRTLSREGAPSPVAGLGEQVALGAFGPVKDDPAVALRLRFLGDPPDDLDLYVRGRAFDTFDGALWRDTLGGREAVQFWAPMSVDEGRPVAQLVLPIDIQSDVIFGLADVVGVVRPGGVERDLNGTWWHAPGRPGSWQIRSLIPSPAGWERLSSQPGAESAVERAARRSGAWTWLPPSLDPRIDRLASELAAGATSPFATMAALAAGLGDRCVYSTGSEGGPADLADFLFTERRGHCEFFASALAVMGRQRGVPTRLVTGFRGGEAAGDERIFHQADAHAWVEAWLGAAGWVRFDATPEAPPEQVPGPGARLAAGVRAALRYDQKAQLALVASALSRGAQIVVALGLPLLLLRLGTWLASRRHPASGRVARLWDRTLRLARRRGWRVPENLPAVEAARWLVRQAGGIAHEAEALAWLHHRVRYGGALDRDLSAQARRHYRSLVRGLPRRRLGPMG